MKIKTVFTILVVMVTMHLTAQAPMTSSYANAIGNFDFGIKAGLNLSTQKASIDVPNFPVTITTIGISSYHFGVYSDFKLTEKASLLTEILYSQEGALVNLQALAFEQKVSYVKAPILYRHTIFTEGLSVHLGPQFAILVKDYIEFDNNDGDPFIDADFKAFEFSAAFGVEYQISHKFKVGARYNLGLSDISNTDEGSYKNRNFQVYAGFNLL